MRQTKPKYYSILYYQLHSYSYALSFKLMGIWKTGNSFLTFFFFYRQICFMIDLLKYWNSPYGKGCYYNSNTTTEQELLAPINLQLIVFKYLRFSFRINKRSYRYLCLSSHCLCQPVCDHFLSRCPLAFLVVLQNVPKRTAGALEDLHSNDMLNLVHFSISHLRGRQQLGCSVPGSASKCTVDNALLLFQSSSQPIGNTDHYFWACPVPVCPRL